MAHLLTHAFVYLHAPQYRAHIALNLNERIMRKMCNAQTGGNIVSKSFGFCQAKRIVHRLMYSVALKKETTCEPPGGNGIDQTIDRSPCNLHLGCICIYGLSEWSVSVNTCSCRYFYVLPSPAELSNTIVKNEIDGNNYSSPIVRCYRCRCRM